MSCRGDHDRADLRRDPGVLRSYHAENGGLCFRHFFDRLETLKQALDGMQS
jgi:hypothetical protein